MPLHNPLLPKPFRPQTLPARNQPLPTRPRKTLFPFKKHQIIQISPPSRDFLPLPLAFTKMHAGEVRSGFCRLAVLGNFDGLGCQGMLGGDGGEALI
jgi:hypothetical protein